MTGGVDFYRFIEELDAQFEKKQPEIAEKLSELMDFLFRPENLVVSCTAERKSLEEKRGLEDLRPDSVRVPGR